jgi:hypothetical protein
MHTSFRSANKNLFVESILLTLVCVATLVAVPVSPRPSDPGSELEELAWMAGDWNAVGDAAQVDEHWSRPAGHMMMGMSRTVSNDHTLSFEYLRIETRDDGIFLVAHPHGRPGVDFRLSSWDGVQAVFTNPGHADHLKRIVYRRETGDSMTARIEGEDAGKPFSQEWKYRRESRK